MNTSDKLNEIAPALVAALAKMQNPRPDAKATVETKKGYTYSYNYLSLPELLNAVRKVFSEVGLAILQEVVGTQRGIGVTTRIVHSISGQFIEAGPLELPAGGTPQEHGSAITYARRYSLSAIVGLAADEDDDAAKAQRSAGEGHTDASPQSRGGGVGIERTTPADSSGGVATGGGHTEPEAAPSGRSLPPHPFQGDGLVCAASFDGDACNYAADWPGHSKVRAA